MRALQGLPQMSSGRKKSVSTIYDVFTCGVCLCAYLYVHVTVCLFVQMRAWIMCCILPYAIYHIDHASDRMLSARGGRFSAANTTQFRCRFLHQAMSRVLNICVVQIRRICIALILGLVQLLFG